MPKKLKVFLCHSSNDKPAVREIYQRLKLESWIEPWLDEEELFPGQDWGLEIEKAVEETDTVLVFLSNKSVTKKGYVQKELRMVLRISDYQPNGTIFTIPLRLENCSVPRALSMWQYVDFFPETRQDWAYKRLLGGLKIRAKKLGIDLDGEGKAESEQVASSKRQVESLQEKQAREIAVQERIEKRARELALEIAQKEREERKRNLADLTGFKNLSGLSPKSKKISGNPANIEWIKISAGEFTMGSNDYKDEKPLHKVYLDEYLIAKTPVTNAQFKKFMDAGGYKNKEFWSEEGWNWLSGKNPAQSSYWDNTKWNTSTHPVVVVSWYEAEAFSIWANCRLPSEAEWEKAARGDSPLLEGEGAGVRVYSWGNQEPNKDLANYSQNVGKTTPVGKYSPAGDSPYGCVDMAGNVWEWTSSLYKKYPYDSTDGREDLSISGSRVLRGGSWLSYVGALRSALRSYLNPTFTLNNIGFRCSRSRP